MTDENEVEQGEEADEALPPEEVMHGPDGALDCVTSRYELVAFWLAKLGIEDPTGSAIAFGEGCSLAILHPLTGEWLTPQQIAKKAGHATVSRIQ
jgi:hypothetical protein